MTPKEFNFFFWYFQHEEILHLFFVKLIIFLFFLFDRLPMVNYESIEKNERRIYMLDGKMTTFWRLSPHYPFFSFPLKFYTSWHFVLLLWKIYPNELKRTFKFFLAQNFQRKFKRIFLFLIKNFILIKIVHRRI